MKSRRRDFVQAMAGLGAALATSSSAAAQAQTRPPAPPGSDTADSAWGPFTPSSNAGQYLQLVYPPSSKAGELQIGVTYTLWIPDGIRTVRAVIVHQHGASIPAAQAGQHLPMISIGRPWQKNGTACCSGPSYRVLNDAIDLTPGGAELWFDPDAVPSAPSFGLWTNLRPSRATRKSPPRPGVFGGIREGEYGPM